MRWAIFAARTCSFAIRSLFRNSDCDAELRIKSQVKNVAWVGDIDNIGQVHNGQTQEEVV